MNRIGLLESVNPDEALLNQLAPNPFAAPSQFSIPALSLPPANYGTPAPATNTVTQVIAQVLKAINPQPVTSPVYSASPYLPGQAVPMVAAQSNTSLYLILAAAGIGAYFLFFRKK